MPDSALPEIAKLCNQFHERLSPEKYENERRQVYRNGPYVELLNPLPELQTKPPEEVGMLSSFRAVLRSRISRTNYATYVQGQSPEPRVREYFYYIDHQGMLFLDDARMKNFTSCFKEKKFLAFFFKRLRPNNTGRYDRDFPYLSICGRERNFVRCDDLPIVFTHVLKKQSEETGQLQDWFSYAHAEDLLMVPFEPEKLCMSVKSGRVYHPASPKLGGVGLVRSKLAIEFSELFDFEHGEGTDPTHFNWNGKRYTLDTQWHAGTVLGTK